jgi:hypothetical protein
MSEGQGGFGKGFTFTAAAVSPEGLRDGHG